ncbi:MAG: hypothetical protein CMB80_22395 [Flammeovirgaceae bacterium]|nr:hypothetical protein [Flammeovirgaceae bacterium]MBE62662.1 hypothetical protein [Flammeovirgaceae bacterium]HCX22392.1 hypothetical protein [Cytophagales bacterium]|tara:strand:- start:2686 stop:3264 length:579 start_codon:yes stop_codon:yes gene_type:complete
MNNGTSQREQVIAIIEESFHNNPSVISVINPKKKNSLKALAQYAYDTAKTRNGVILSSNQEAVAICYPYNYKKEGLADIWNQVLLVLNCIGLRRVPDVLRREAYVKKMRPKDGKFLYFWFFGATTTGKKTSAARELKDKIFDWSSKENLPIYLETSVPRNKSVYEYYGFETYHEWNQPNGGTLYFMRRNPGV